MHSHVVLGADDLDQAKTFYDGILGTLGAGEGVRRTDKIVYAHDGGVLVMVKPLNGQPAAPASGSTLAFKSASAEQIEAWHAAGIANGGTSCEDPPGYRHGEQGKLSLADLRDPVGNKLCGIFRPVSS